MITVASGPFASETLQTAAGDTKILWEGWTLSIVIAVLVEDERDLGAITRRSGNRGS